MIIYRLHIHNYYIQTAGAIGCDLAAIAVWNRRYLGYEVSHQNDIVEMTNTVRCTEDEPNSNDDLQID